MRLSSFLPGKKGLIALLSFIGLMGAGWYLVIEQGGWLHRQYRRLTTYALMDTAETLYKHGDLSKARHYAEKVLRSSPDHKIAHQLLLQIYMKRHQYHQVLRQAKRLIQLPSTDQSTYYYAALAAYHLQDYRGGEYYLNHAPRPLNQRDLELLLNIYIKQQRYHQALKQARELIRIAPGEHSSYYYAAVASYHLGNYAQSQHYILQGIRVMSADNPDPRLVIELIHISLQENRQAYAHYLLKHLPLLPGRPGLLLTTARLASRLHDDKRLSRALHLLRPLTPMLTARQHATYWHLLAQRHARQGQLARAEQGYRRMLHYYPSAQNWAAYSYFSLKQQRYDQAIHAMREAIKQRPGKLIYQLSLGYSYLSAGQPFKAIDQYRAATLIKPGDPNIYAQLGFAQADAPGFPRRQAEQSFRQALALLTSDSHNNLQQPPASPGTPDTIMPAATDQARSSRSNQPLPPHEPDPARMRQAIQNVAKEWSLLFSDSVRLAPDDNADDETDEYPPLSYKGYGSLVVYYQPQALQNQEWGSLDFISRTLWTNRNRSVVPQWNLFQTTLGVRYKPINGFNGYISAERVFGLGWAIDDGIPNGYRFNIGYGRLDGAIWQQDQSRWFYQRAYIRESVTLNTYALNTRYPAFLDDGGEGQGLYGFLSGFYNVGEVFTMNWDGLKSGILPYVSLGGLFMYDYGSLDGLLKFDPNATQYRIDGGIGLSYLIWNNNPVYDTPSVYHRLGVETRLRFLGNTDDNYTVRVYYELML